MNYYPNSPIEYRRGFSISILPGKDDAVQNSLYYYFDYDSRNKAVNMEFPHFHVFYEIMILLSPKCYHFLEGKKYDLQADDIILLPPSSLHQSEYIAGTPSDRIIIGFKWPKDTVTDHGLEEILSLFHAPIPIYRFHKEAQIKLFQPLNDLVELSSKNTSTALKNLMIHTKFIEFMYTLYEMKDQNQYAPSTETGAGEKIYNVTSYIHTHYTEDLSLKNIAESFYISPY